MIVLGNGKSRQSLNLNNIQEEKIGCNAIIRDQFVHYLVCCDKKMVKQALEQNYKPVYTRQRWVPEFNSEDVLSLPNLPYKGKNRQDDPFHWGSGPYAVLLATTMSKYIKLVGFDLYGINGKLNNMYASTNGYLNNDADEVDWTYWVYQIAKIFKLNPDKTFHIYNLENWILPKEWNFKNIKVDNVDNL